MSGPMTRTGVTDIACDKSCHVTIHLIRVGVWVLCPRCYNRDYGPGEDK